MSPEDAQVLAAAERYCVAYDTDERGLDRAAYDRWWDELEAAHDALLEAVRARRAAA